MKHCFWLMIFISVLGAGCVSHYYKIDAERVNLYLRVPGAKTVYFSTSLDQFESYPAKKLEAGMWEVTVPAGREFTYFYNVDGVIYLPDCRLKQKDDFGAENCVFAPDK